jgi:hypothetical protein
MTHSGEARQTVAVATPGLPALVSATIRRLPVRKRGQRLAEGVGVRAPARQVPALEAEPLGCEPLGESAVSAGRRIRPSCRFAWALVGLRRPPAGLQLVQRRDQLSGTGGRRTRRRSAAPRRLHVRTAILVPGRPRRFSRLRPGGCHSIAS